MSATRRDPELLTAEEAARLLRTSPRKVRWYARRGLIPAARISNRWRFSRDQLLGWVEREAERERARRALPADPAEEAWERLALESLDDEYGPEDEGLYDDPDALGYERVAL